jgi:glycogen operon protein
VTGLVEPGASRPLGATWDGAGVNFAVYSLHAEAVEVCLFDASGKSETARLPLPEHTDGVWHGYAPGVEPGTLYGLRVYGPYAPQAGHRFNHHKLLIDPYARCLRGELQWTDELYGYSVRDPDADLSFDTRDSAPFVPKCVVVASERYDTGPRPETRWSKTVIYEGHVRGLTMRHPGVPEELRGTFAGLASPAMIEHLRRIGVTAVELLPVHAFLSERFLVEAGRSNYWGYNSIAFFAPHSAYLASGHPRELAAMVASLHEAGIEVLLDVVYNHTAEGGELGPTLSLRGIDNASYYRLDPDDQRYYENVTGTGNTIDASHPGSLRMILDSLRYWSEEMGVDGFRFDLASALAREDRGFDRSSGFLDAVGQDPVLGARKLIAEPWDIGHGGYRLGGFPPGWSEWNDRFRDATRSFWRGDPGRLPEFASRMSGSSDIFENEGRRPWASINFVTAHDGFTLRDVVSYASKHNHANGELNGDGHDENHSANYGVEGPTDDPEINAVRARQQRNLLATLLLAQGCPMMLAGDELGHTQLGNNNAYAQDNGTTWLDWENADAGLSELVARLSRIRREYPVLRSPVFLHGPVHLRWLTPAGEAMTVAEWEDPGSLGVTIVLTPRSPEDSELAIGINAAAEAVDFELPDSPRAWSMILSTGDGRLDDGRLWRAQGRSLAVFAPAPGQ